MNISLEQITKESISFGRDKDTNSLSDLIGNINNNIRSMFSFIVGNKNKSEFSPSDIESTLVRFNNERGADATYQSVKNIGIYIPPGLNGRFVEYANALAEVNALAGDVEKLYIKPIKRYVAAILSDPKQIGALSVDVYDPSGVNIDKAAALTKKFLTNTTRTDMAKFGEVYGNLNEISKTADGLIAARTNLSLTSKETVHESARELTLLVDKLIIRMKQKPELFNLTPNGSKNLSNLLYTAGRAVEFYGAAENETRIAIKAFVDSF